MAKNIHNRRVFRDIVTRRTTILIRVCVASSNGVALINIGFTLGSGILMSIPTTYWENLQGPIADPPSLEETYRNIFPFLPLILTDGVRPNLGTGSVQ